MASVEFPRHFVRAGDSLSEWPQISPYFDKLRTHPIDNPQRLNDWLLGWSELEACVDEVGKRRYVAMTCQTDDAQRKQAYLDFVEHIEPKCKPMWHAIHEKYASSAARDKLSPERFEVFDRCVVNAVELFREENVPLQVEEAKLEQRYQEVTSAMTVMYDGSEQTLQRLATYLERTDRKVRREVWELSAERRFKDAGELENIFDALFKLRHQIALNAGMSDYRAYAFKAKERFDYTPEDCLAFHDAVEKTCVPLMRAQLAYRKRLMGLDELRPWDLSVDVKGRPPLKPFEDSRELVDGCTRIFDKIDAELATQFHEMTRRGDLDLESRKGKAPGGYQSTFQESRRPFIFMNAVGMLRDVRTLLHECGHAFHAMACRHDPLVHYRSAPIEFSEVASMGMEMLAYEHLDEFFKGEDLNRAKRNQLEGIVGILPWIATIDAFQHWMYTNPMHTREQRTEQWLALHGRFGGTENYSGFEHVLASNWQRQLHLFEVPFYYIEYGIAQLGALQVWRNAKRDHGKALTSYRRALSKGGSLPLPALFETAGIRFDFSVETLGPLMDLVQKELESIGD